MTVPDLGDGSHLLAELYALGIQLEADGERLRFRPREAVTPDIAARLKAHKAELLAAVGKRDALDRRIAEQVRRLVPYTTADGRQVLVNPRYRRELERLGLL